MHTINPFTGFTEKNDMISASVIAKNCAYSDAYATRVYDNGIQKIYSIFRKKQKPRS